MRRLKILFITNWYPSPANPVTGIFIKDYAKAVSRHHDVTVLHTFKSSNPIKCTNSISESIEDGIKTIRINHKVLPIPRINILVRTWSTLCWFRRILKEGYKPDIIHAFVYSAGLPAVILGRFYQIPVVITELYTNILKKEMSKLEKFMLRFVMNRAEIILSISESLKKALIEYGIHNEICIIPCTVDISKYISNRTNYNPKIKTDISILFIGNLIPRKGIPYLLKALSQILKKRNDFTLDIVGNGPQKKKYIDLSSKLGIENHVKFHGLVDEAKKVELIKKCSFFILPSSWENFGVVLIEAMAAGKPVIAAARGGPREIIKEDIGILAVPKDVKSLRESIDYMLEKNQNYSPKNIAQYVKERFSYEAVGKMLDKIYLEIIAKR